MGFLTKAGVGRTIVHRAPKQTFFSKGESANSVFYLSEGRARLTVVSAAGNEATITLLNESDCIGEEALTAFADQRLATATAMTSCTAVKFEKAKFMRVLQQEHVLSEIFLAFLLSRSMRTQADLVNQLFNSSEKRLARVLLLMADFDKPDDSEKLLPKLSQEALAGMVGTTRSRVSFFMNRFRSHGFID